MSNYKAVQRDDDIYVKDSQPLFRDSVNPWVIERLLKETQRVVSGPLAYLYDSHHVESELVDRDDFRWDVGRWYGRAGFERLVVFSAAEEAAEQKAAAERSKAEAKAAEAAKKAAERKAAKEKALAKAAAAKAKAKAKAAEAKAKAKAQADAKASKAAKAAAKASPLVGPGRVQDQRLSSDRKH
eukprot:Skav230267  [mRNA]  locus=scaffold3387:266038:279609:+ [translate_table: standard]